MKGPALALAFLASPAWAADDAPVFEVKLGADAPLAGDEQNEFLLPCGGGPASFAVGADGKWWVLDAIAGKVVVLDRTGAVTKTIAFPAPPEPKAPRKKKRIEEGKRAPHFRSDLALDGTGGVWVLDATQKRVEHYSAEGKLDLEFGDEKIPRETRGRLELPQRISEREGELWIADNGSETLLRFAKDGAFLGAIPGNDSAPSSGGAVFLLASDVDAAYLETWPDEGPLGIPSKKRVATVKAAKGKVLHDVELLGATTEGHAILGVIEGNDEEAERIRVLRVDRSGRIAGERPLPPPKDDASPVRRWRLTAAGKIAWFQIKDGKLQAFEADLPRAR